MARQHAIETALSCGTSFPSTCPSNYTFWALPVSLNNKVIGSLITVGDKRKASGDNPSELTKAQTALFEIAETYNIINRAFLQQKNKLNSYHFSRRASSENQPCFDMNSLWENQGRNLIEKISHGNRTDACTLLNEILHVFLAAPQNTLPQAKGFSLGLFALAVESSSPYQKDRSLLFSFHSEIAEIIIKSRDYEELGHCIRQGLQSILDVNCCRHSNGKKFIVRKIHNYIERHLDNPLSREEMAQEVGLSPSRLSHLIKKETNHSLSEIVKRFRLDRACKLLLHSDKSISEIAIECGFCDQSHFTKVFHKRHDCAPMEYRSKNSLRN